MNGALVPDPGDPDHLRAHLPVAVAALVGCRPPRLVGEPCRIAAATSTWVWFVDLDGADLPDRMRAPLVVRVYDGQGAPTARREHDLCVRLHGLGYPAPEPLLVDDGTGPLGLPFVVQARAPGIAVLDDLAGRPHRLFATVRDLAALQARLHLLPPGDTGLPDGPTAPAYLSEDLDRRWHRCGEPADARLEWLHRSAAGFPDTTRVICHGDFHPLNVLVDRSGGRRDAPDRYTVLDWTDARIGDPHLDVARTLAMLWLGAEVTAGATAVVLRALGNRLRRLHRRTWESATGVALDPGRLLWWEAVHVHRGWLQTEELRLGAVRGPDSDTVASMPPGLPARLTMRFDELRDASEAGALNRGPGRRRGRRTWRW